MALLNIGAAALSLRPVIDPSFSMTSRSYLPPRQIHNYPYPDSSNSSLTTIKNVTTTEGKTMNPNTVDNFLDGFDPNVEHAA